MTGQVVDRWLERFNRGCALSIVLLLFLSPWFLKAALLQPELLPPPAEVKESNIIGFYALDGRDSSGKGYTGTVLVTRIKENYVFTWLLERGGSCKGIGFREGDVLTVGAVCGDELVAFRFEVSEVDGKPVLKGQYAMGGSRGTETLTLLRRLSL